ncbi:sensor histidine kinase KdpD, partial [mine drainage metagenome]
LVRRARRLSNSLHGEWLAVYVETPQLQHLPQAARDRVLRTLKLAESLGAQTDNLSGEHVAEELLNFARQRNVSKIIVGKPMRTRLRDRLRPNLVDALIRGSGDIDVLVVTSEPGAAVAAMPRLPRRNSRRPAYLKGLVAVLLATVLCAALFRVLGPTNLVMIYLLAVVWVAARYGRGPSVLAAVTSVALFDFLFV